MTFVVQHIGSCIIEIGVTFTSHYQWVHKRWSLLIRSCYGVIHGYLVILGQGLIVELAGILGWRPRERRKLIEPKCHEIRA